MNIDIIRHTIVFILNQSAVHNSNLSIIVFLLELFHYKYWKMPSLPPKNAGIGTSEYVNLCTDLIPYDSLATKWYPATPS